MTALTLSTDGLRNPVDMAELVVMERDLSFDRLDDGELMAEIPGTWSSYRLWFTWQEELGGITVSCSLEAKLPKTALPQVHALLSLANEKMWIGHFEVNADFNTVMFRHSLLLDENGNISANQLRSLLDIAVQECERFFPAFQSLVWGGKSPAQALELALFETIAEA